MRRKVALGVGAVLTLRAGKIWAFGRMEQRLMLPFVTDGLECCRAGRTRKWAGITVFCHMPLKVAHQLRRKSALSTFVDVGMRLVHVQCKCLGCAKALAAIASLAHDLDLRSFGFWCWR